MIRLLQKMKINVRLLLGFGILIILIVIMSSTSINNINLIAKQTENYAQRTYPNSNKLWTIRRDLVSTQRYILQGTIASHTTEVRTLFSKAKADLDESVSTVQELMKTEAQLQEGLAKVEVALKSLYPILEKIQNFCEGGTPTYAIASFNNEFVGAFNKANEAVLEIYNIQVDNAALQEQISDNVKNSSIILIVGLSLVCLVFSVVISLVITRSITKPLNEAEKSAREVANGNLGVNIRVTTNDEIGALVKSFIQVRDVFRTLVDKIVDLAEDFDKGDIDVRISEDEFKGDFKHAASEVNMMVDGIIKDNLSIVECLNWFEHGHFDINIKPMPGKKAVASKALETLQSNLLTVSGDLSHLIDAAIEGRLDASLDTSKYEGDWQKLALGLNKLLKVINEPIAEANNMLEELSEGHFDVHVSKGYKGSFAVMMDSFEKMVKTVGLYIDEITTTLDTIASGDFRQGISREYVGQFSNIKTSINSIVDTMKVTITEIRSASENVLLGAQQISGTSMNLASSASTQALSLDKLNYSISAINEQTSASADKAKNANELSQHAIENAQSGNKEMFKMLKSMDDIKESSRNISKIIKVIDDIAFQTNLLALNASVEAARAGQHGKGFAVVAEEVRSLAGRSQTAARETSELIEDTIRKVNDGTKIAQLTAEGLSAIVSSTDSITEIIAEIFNSAQQQASGISQLAIGINQVSNVVQETSSTSEETAAAAEELNGQSDILARMVGQFKV